MENSNISGVTNKSGIERNFSRVCHSIVVDDAEEVLYILFTNYYPTVCHTLLTSDDRCIVGVMTGFPNLILLIINPTLSDSDVNLSLIFRLCLVDQAGWQ